MRSFVLASVLFAALVVVPTALAVFDGTYRGRSSQGFRVTAQSTDTQVQRVNIPWRATDCLPRDGYSISVRSFVYKNDESMAIEQDGSRFGASRRVSLKSDDGRAIVSARMSGRMTDHDRVAGTQRINVRTSDGEGKHRCSARIKWSAKLVRRGRATPR
jgi:hypothetical protein